MIRVKRTAKSAVTGLGRTWRQMLVLSFMLTWCFAGNAAWGWILESPGPTNALDNGVDTIALGTRANATAIQSTAVGGDSKAVGDYATAIGQLSWADGDYSVAIGQNSVSGGLESTAIGQDSSAAGDFNTAVGRSAYTGWFDANGDNVVDAGELTQKATAIGHDSWAERENSTAIGQNSWVNADSGTALGQGTRVESSATGAVAIGQGSVADVANTVSVGTSLNLRKIVNVEGGTAATDVATYGQLSTEVANRIADVNAEETRALLAEGALNTAIGDEVTNRIADVDAEEERALLAEGALSTAIGTEVANRIADVDAEEARALLAESALNTAIGTEVANRIADVNAEETRALAAEGQLQTSINNEATARNNADTALQNNINAINGAGVNALKITGPTGAAPANASATGIGSTAVGSGASARTRDTAIGYMAIVAADGSVAVGANTTVNSVNSIAVGADSLIEANAAGSSAIGQGARVVSGATASVALGQNSVATAPNTVSFGSPGNERRLTNVAPGIDDTDAVNMSQLRQIANSQLTEVGRLDGRIDDLEGKLDDVGALTSAFSALVPNARAKGDTQLSLGVGSYSSSSALAAGLFHYLNNNILFNAGLSTDFDGNETATRAGITIGW